jgi:hypothetical protein
MTMNLKPCNHTINFATDSMAIHREKAVVPLIGEHKFLTSVKILLPFLNKRVTHSQSNYKSSLGSSYSDLTDQTSDKTAFCPFPCLLVHRVTIMQLLLPIIQDYCCFLSVSMLITIIYFCWWIMQSTRINIYLFSQNIMAV